jgi:UDP-GlcNAc:undecaprenyl-phosphate GlcNAc-1-phosphate transferase
LFLGDAGAQVLGFWLASLAIAYHPRDVNQMSSWFATILLLGVPIFDMLLVVISRLRRKCPVYSSSSDHTYHRLRDLGLDPNRAVLLMHIVAVVLGCLSIVGLHQPPLIANLIFGLVVLCGLGVLIFFEATLTGSQKVADNP